MKIKYLYEQYGLDKTHDIIKYKDDRFFQTEKYMFYLPLEYYQIALNPEYDDFEANEYFNKHILNYEIKGNTTEQKIKNIFNEHLD